MKVQLDDGVWEFDAKGRGELAEAVEKALNGERVLLTLAPERCQPKRVPKSPGVSLAVPKPYSKGTKAFNIAGKKHLLQLKEAIGTNGLFMWGLQVMKAEAKEEANA